jgi:hypothetical protein
MSRKPGVPFWQLITLGTAVYLYYPDSLNCRFSMGHIGENFAGGQPAACGADRDINRLIFSDF